MYMYALYAQYLGGKFHSRNTYKLPGKTFQILRAGCFLSCHDIEKGNVVFYLHETHPFMCRTPSFRNIYISMHVSRIFKFKETILFSFICVFSSTRKYFSICLLPARNFVRNAFLRPNALVLVREVTRRREKKQQYVPTK